MLHVWGRLVPDLPVTNASFVCFTDEKLFWFEIECSGDGCRVAQPSGSRFVINRGKLGPPRQEQLA